MYGTYATAWEVVEYLDIIEEDSQSYVIKDPRFFRFTTMMSRKFDTLAKRSFFPFRTTDSYDDPDQLNVLPNTLQLNRDLLSLITLTTNNGGTIITSDNILLRSGFDLNRTPKDLVELKTDSTQTTFQFSGTQQEANTVDGIYGYHERYSDAWQQLDTIQDAVGLNATVTTVTVTDADAFDEVGLKPRFQEQQLIRFGTEDTDEMAYIIGVNYTSNKLEVIRGVNGNTAAIQANGTVIQVFRPQEEIKHALLVLATHAYRRKDSVGNESERDLFTASGVLVIPQKIPQEVADMVLAYKKPSVWTG